MTKVYKMMNILKIRLLLGRFQVFTEWPDPDPVFIDGQLHSDPQSSFRGSIVDTENNFVCHTNTFRSLPQLWSWHRLYTCQ